MKIFNTVKKVIYSACLYFTAATFIIVALVSSVDVSGTANGSTASLFLTLGGAAMIFAACLAMSLLNLVWHLRFPTPVNAAIHFVGALTVWAVMFVVIPGVYSDSSMVIVRMGIFVVLYAVIGLIALVVNLIKKIRLNNASEYEEQFTKSKK